MRILRWTLAAAAVALALTAVHFAAGAAGPLAEDDDAMVRLGKLIFFDETLSRPIGQSCASCHEPTAAFADPNPDVPVSRGAVRSRFGNRNAPSVSYAMYAPPLYFDPAMTPAIPEGQYKGGQFWDGRADTLEDQARQPFLNPLEMHAPNITSVVLSVRASSYDGLFLEVFGDDAFDDDEAAFGNVARALAAYMRSPEVNPFSSKYDAWKKGQAELTPAEMRGYMLVQPMGKGRCGMCHPEGPRGLFTNFGHQNLGIPANPANPFYDLPRPLNPAGRDYVDPGIGGFLSAAGVAEDLAVKEIGKQKIPCLRNCAVTAPYTHNGYHRTLREVVVFNNTRDEPWAVWPAPEYAPTVHRHPMSMPGTFGRLGLTDAEIDDIVAFLNTLTDGYLR